MRGISACAAVGVGVVWRACTVGVVGGRGAIWGEWCVWLAGWRGAGVGGSGETMVKGGVVRMVMSEGEEVVEDVVCWGGWGSGVDGWSWGSSVAVDRAWRGR